MPSVLGLRLPALLSVIAFASKRLPIHIALLALMVPPHATLDFIVFKPHLYVAVLLGLPGTDFLANRDLSLIPGKGVEKKTFLRISVEKN